MITVLTKTQKHDIFVRTVIMVTVLINSAFVRTAIMIAVLTNIATIIL